MSYTTIRARIIELLEEISEIAVVTDHDPDKLAKYPAVTVEAGSHQDTFFDTAANQRNFSFLIRCYYPISSGRDQSAENRLSVVVDRIIEVLEAHVDEPGVWDIGRPTRAVWGKDEREVPIRFVEITFTAESRVVR
jgi:hypothetical protein